MTRYYVHHCINSVCYFYGVTLYAEVFTPTPAAPLPVVLRCDWCGRDLAPFDARDKGITCFRSGLAWKCNVCQFVLPRPYDPRDDEPKPCPRCGSSNWLTTNIAMLFKGNLGMDIPFERGG